MTKGDLAFYDERCFRTRYFVLNAITMAPDSKSLLCRSSTSRKSVILSDRGKFSRRKTPQCAFPCRQIISSKSLSVVTIIRCSFTAQLKILLSHSGVILADLGYVMPQIIQPTRYDSTYVHIQQKFHSAQPTATRSKISSLATK